MVYGYLLMGLTAVATLTFLVKYYNTYAGGTGPTKAPKTRSPQIGGMPWQSKRPPANANAATKTKTKTTTKPLTIRESYVGNGWWSTDHYFGWELPAYGGLAWGSGRPTRRPKQFGHHGFTLPPSLPAGSADWLHNLQQLFVQGHNIVGETDGAVAGWLFATTSTGSTSTTEETSDYVRIVVTASKDHAHAPPGGWGVDYNPYHYHVG